MNVFFHYLRASIPQAGRTNLGQLARDASITKRALTYILAGERVPSRDTLEHIIAAARLPDDIADRLRHLRDQAQAERAGLALPERDAKQLPRLVRRLTAETVVYLRQRHGLPMPELERQRLAARLERIVKTVMEPLRTP